ncbi:MAG: toxin-antitoxin system YwqK family antitoxin, partial [Flavobacteriales bacterium]
MAKKIRILCFILFLFGNCVHSQVGTIGHLSLRAPLCEEVEGLLVKHDSLTLHYTGKAKWCFENGYVKKTCRFVDGKREGLYCVYDFQGDLKATGNHLNDKLHGIYKEFSSLGKLSKSCEFKYGRLEGNYLEFHQDGSL